MMKTQKLQMPMETYTAVTAPVIINIGAAGYSAQENQEVRHFDKYVLKVLQDQKETLSKLFNNGAES